MGFMPEEFELCPMEFYERISKVAGKSVVVWEKEQELKNPANTIYRLKGLFAEFLNLPGVDEVTGLLFVTLHSGCDNTTIEKLVAARQHLPRLKAVFLGDMDISENELGDYWQISWIPYQQYDVSLLFDAYPELECLQTLSGNGHDPDLGALQNATHLRALIMQTNGLSARVARQIAEADLPALEHLEVYVGTHSYGGSSTMEDIAPILSGEKFPKLKYLGLRNCDEFTDEVARTLAQSPLMSRLEVLDLSLGSLSDEGAQALLDCPHLLNLKKLDIHFHFCSEAMMEKLKALPIEVDVSDPNADEGFRYCAVSE